jgi:TIR domain
LAYDLFISYSSEDKLTAEAVCNRLESAGVRCWIAPRDISPGEEWTAAIVRGIELCRVMVLVFSDHANESPHVRREVAQACRQELIVIPIRIERINPSGDLQYYLSELHWLDALTPPLEKHLEALSARVAHLLSGDPIDPLETPSDRKKPRPFFRPVRWIALLTVVLIGIVTTVFLSTRNNRPAAAGPVAETAIPIPPVINLPDGLRVVLGEQQTLLNDKELGLRDMPGNGVAVIENTPDLLQVLFYASGHTYLVEGRDIKHLTSAHPVIEPGRAGEFDSCWASVGAVVRWNGQLYAFYEAGDCQHLPILKAAGIWGFYGSVGIAESSDAGTTWLKGGQILNSAVPKEYQDFPNQAARGIGQPGAVLDPSDRYIYLYYACFSGPKSARAICMARADLRKGPPRPGSWEKLHDGAFGEPGLGGKTPRSSIISFPMRDLAIFTRTWCILDPLRSTS